MLSKAKHPYGVKTVKTFAFAYGFYTVKFRGILHFAALRSE
jgi:hypothetical protein